MRIRGWTGLGVFGAILAATACSSTDAEPGCLGSAGSSAAGAGNDGSAGRGTGQDAGTGGDIDIPSGNEEAGASGAGSGPSAALPASPDGFSPSNLEPDLDLSVDADFVLNGETCGDEAHLNTDTGQIDCSQSGAQVAYQFQIAKQGDGSEVGVFAGRNITVAPNVLVVVEGQRPLVLLTPGDVQINGTIEAVANRISSYEGNAGGFSGPAGEQVKGKGPGGGSGTSTEAGGGAFCGKGGNGGSATGAPGGVPYGTAELVPLIGGSSGGSGALGGRGGAGGGAVQIIAGGKLTLAATGVIHVGGAGGGWNGGGGGSGGAILLEANVITIAGTLAANGGGGGEGDGVAGDSGLNASPDAVPAPSGNGTATSDDNGGDGSAAKLVDGSPGGIVSGGGGGGAGRIRLNSKSGMALVSGVLSPSADSDCVTQGVLGS
jgi:hypothetical protein